MGDRTDRMRGQIKEKLGQVIRDPGLAQKGRDEQAKGDIKRSLKKAGDAVRKQA